MAIFFVIYKFVDNYYFVIRNEFRPYLPCPHVQFSWALNTRFLVQEIDYDAETNAKNRWPEAH